jgi:hypothetical protein
MGRGQTLVDLEDAVHSENGAVRLAGELVGAVAGSDSDSKRIDAGFLDEIDGLLRISKVCHGIDAGAVAVLDAAQNAQFPFDGDAPGVGVVDDL